MHRCRTVILLLAMAVFGAACDRTPVDPIDGSVDVASLLFGSEAARHPSSPLSLPALVQAAVLKVYTEHGADAARATVTGLRRLQEQGRNSAEPADREAAQAVQTAVVDEQIALVLRVFGDAVVEHVIEAARADAATLGGRLDRIEESAPAGERIRELLAQVAELLTDAEAAAANGAFRSALVAATDAATSLDAARAELAESMRVPGLDQLFERATRMTAANGSTAADDLLRNFRELQQSAQQAVRTGNRQRAQAALEAVRTEQITVVLDVLGEDVVKRVLQQTAAGGRLLAADARAAHEQGRDTGRVERMLVTATDLATRAGVALQSGDAVLALDLACHAAGLVNAARLALGAG